MNYIVALGDPFDGFTLYGPFVDSDEATNWAENNAGDQAWTVAELETP